MEDVRDSLADRMAQRFAVQGLRPEPRSPRPVNWRLAAALTGVIALGPLATIVGAGAVEHGARAEAARLETQAAPRLKAEARERAVRAALRAAVRDAGVVVWLDRVAAAIPAEARVARMAKTADGALELEISTPDPDLLRGALRGDPALAGFRETGQRRAGAMIAVTLRRAP